MELGKQNPSICHRVIILLCKGLGFSFGSQTDLSLQVLLKKLHTEEHSTWIKDFLPYYYMLPFCRLPKPVEKDYWSPWECFSEMLTFWGFII